MTIRASLKKAALAAAALATVFGGIAPAYAGGGHHGGRHGYYGRPSHHAYHHPQRYHGRYYYGSRHYRGYHHRRGLSGGEAALIAAGIIGGIILIDRAMEAEAYDRYSRDRYDDPYYNRRYQQYGDGYGSGRDFSYRRDERAYGSSGYDDRYDGRYDDRSDGYDDELAGGRDYADAGSGSSYNYGAAYNDCKAETRDAAGDSGVLVALPAKPRVIDPIDGGEAVRFRADVIARDLQGVEYRRVMTCEADAQGVRFLEIT